MSQSKFEAIRKIRDDLEVFLDGTLKEDVIVVLPENMSKTFPLNNKPVGVAEVKWLSGCYNIIHTILEVSFDKRYFKGKWSSFVPLDSKILRRVCGTFYKPHFIENLIELKIIECDGKYSTIKHSSLGYRLTKKYRGQPLKNRTIQDPGIKKAAIQHHKERLVELKKRIRPIAHLARWAIYEKLELNKPEALEYLEAYRYRMLKEIAKRNLKSSFQREETTFVNTRYYKAKYQVESWGSSSRITVDEAGGRLYTRVTGLMSPLRHFLTYNVESLVSFDLWNNQPLHFLLLLQPGFWKKDAVGLSLEKLDIGLFNYISKLGDKAPAIRTILSAQTPAGRGFKNPGFRFLVQNGKESLGKAQIKDSNVSTESCPVKILSAKPEEQEYSNYKDIRLSWKNVSKKTISGIKFSWEGINAFGEPADMSHSGGFSDDKLRSGKIQSATRVY